MIYGSPFRKEFPEVEKEYDRLAKKCHAAGPLWAHEVFGEGPRKEVGED